MKLAVIGGGAAGFFSALSAKQANPFLEVILIERTAQLLSKVRISGGGRCNVTHSCFDPRTLTQNYPRGSKELLGAFHRFQPRNTVHWFESRGVKLKTEHDGRMFPVTDSSETIIKCLREEATKLGINIWTQCKLKALVAGEKGFFLDVGTDTPLSVDRLVMATGSSRQGWAFAQELGHSIEEPVPSLFTFNVPNFSLVKLSGVSVDSAGVKIGGSRLEQIGPLLITHWGFSGPAALKLSAFGARLLASNSYAISLLIDWLPEMSEKELRQRIEGEIKNSPKKCVKNMKIADLPKSLRWKLFEKAGISEVAQFASVGKSQWNKLVDLLKRDVYEVQGKTTNKEEFVTCGGVRLSEVNFKTMESKKCPGLYFCGEILDVDGVTGGFNFQNAWTTGWIAGQSAGIV